MLRLLPLSFRCCAVQRQEGVLKGGGVEKKSEERRTGGKEGEKGSAWAALQQLQLQQPVRRKEGEKETEGRKRRLQGCLRGSIFMFLHKEKGLIRKPVFSPADAFLYGLMQEACLEIV